MSDKIKIQSVHTMMGASGQLAQPDVADLYKRLMDEEFTEFKDAAAAGDDVEAFDGCLDLIWVTVAYMYARGWPIMEGWAEVERSNLDKIDPETLMIPKRADGKYLKPEGWKPPQLAALLEKLNG